MAKKQIYMGTTKIDPRKTAHEIMNVLADSGARQIATDYGENRTVKALRFIIEVQGQQLAFALPVRVEPLVKHLRDRDQAERTAWRQLLRWVQAQLALIDVGMVKAEEVYAPYQMLPSGETVFEALSTSRFKALPAPAVSR